MDLMKLKRELNAIDKESLVALICNLYQQYPSVKEHLDYYINPDEDVLYKKCREKVRRAFFLKKRDSLQLADGKKALSDFRKFGGSNALFADLMLFYAEKGVDYTNEYGDISMSFYDSVSGVYRKALTLMHDEGILDRFKKRARALVDETNGIGWGFHDDISDTYSRFYGK
jgi:hypothetical protein